MKNISRKKINLVIIILLIAVGFGILMPSLNFGLAADTDKSTSAAPTEDPQNAFLNIISGLILAVNYFIGTHILLPLIEFVVQIIQYNGFLDAYAVEIGWPLVRDLCNMFFVIILLIIAFSTILHISSYHYKNTLLKLVIMAILINFSKPILGFVIDFAQVFMLTFVNAFKDAAQSALSFAFGINTMGEYLADTSQGITPSKDLATVLINLVFLVIASGVMLAYVAVLLWRVITLWVLLVLSPFAFFSMSFPGLQKYAGEYWQKFFGQLSTGVILSFLMWLSFMLFASGTVNSGDTISQQLHLSGGSEKSKLFPTVSNFIVAIALLMMGLEYAQKAGGLAGKVAGSVSGKLSNWGTKALTTPFTAAKKTGKWAANKGVDYGAGKLARSEKVGNFISKVGASKIPGLNRLATRAHVALNQKRKNVEEKAGKYVGAISDNHILERMSKASGVTPFGQAMANAAKNKTPHAVGELGTVAGANEFTSHLTSMTKKDFDSLNPKEMAAIGQRVAYEGLDANNLGTFTTYLQQQSNRSDRKAFNLGQIDANHGIADYSLISGVDPAGKRTGDFGAVHADMVAAVTAPILDPITADILRRTPGKERFWQANESEVKPEKQNSEPPRSDLRGNDFVTEDSNTIAKKNTEKGPGTLSVNEFAKQEKDGTQRSNTIAVDFEKLNLEWLKAPGKDFKDTRGVSLTNSGDIKEVCEKMVGVIDQQIDQLKAKSGRTNGENIKLERLTEAKVRFQSPEKIQKLAMVNSASAGYSAKRLINTKLHEETHLYGVKGEDSTEGAVQRMINSRKYKHSERQEIAEKAAKHEQRAEKSAAKNFSPGYAETKLETEPKTVERIIEVEKSAKAEKDIEKNKKLPAKGEPAKIIREINSVSGAKDSLWQYRMIALLKGLNTSLARQGSGLSFLGKELSSLASGADEKETSPLTVSLLAEEIGATPIAPDEPLNKAA